MKTLKYKMLCWMVVILCAGGLRSSVAAATTNLLINSDAEIGTTQGWVDPDDAWSAAHDITPHGGNYFFWPARKALAYTEMYQDVSVSGMIADIDQGKAFLHLSGWMANWDQYPHDQATLAIAALNSDHQQLLYLFHSHRNPIWGFYKIDSLIPAGTRTLRVLLIAQRFVGNANDAYFDDLSLAIDGQGATATVTITPQGGKPQVLIGGTLQLVASTTGAADTNYIWSSSFNAIAAVDTNGLVSASQGGRFTIQAEGTTTHAVGNLEMVSFSDNSLLLTQPQEGVAWESGSTQNISWDVKGTNGPASIYYRVSSGDWVLITNNVNSVTGTYPWQVLETTTAINSCQIRLTWSGGESVGPFFSIIPRKITPLSLLLHMFAGVTVAGGQVGDQYNIQYVNDLNSTNWTDIGALILTSTNQTWVDLDSINSPYRYYRAVKGQ